MWYNDLISSKIDGLAPLLSKFQNYDDFKNHFFSNVMFFNPEMVTKQVGSFKNKIKDNEALPVRFSLKSKNLFHYKNENTISGNSSKTFKNKSDAQSFIENNDLIHKETGLNVCIDKDGNYFVRKEIFDAVTYKVSQGAISDIKNYMICHVWGITANPLFFTSLWNITLIPQYMSFLTDKPDENSKLVKEVKDIFKAICMELYKPSDILMELLKEQEHKFNPLSIFAPNAAKNVEEQKYLDEITFTAKRYISDGTVHFIDKKSNIEQIQDAVCESVDNTSDDNIDNKTFALLQLEKLADVNVDGLIEILADPIECKHKFDLAFPMLKEFIPNNKSIFEDNTGRQRYYKKDTFFEYNEKKYIICNHWYPKQRGLFELWVYGNTNI